MNLRLLEFIITALGLCGFVGLAVTIVLSIVAYIR
jgi:hypothetical protein